VIEFDLINLISLYVIAMQCFIFAFVACISAIVFMGHSTEFALKPMEYASKIGMFNGRYLFIVFFMLHRKYNSVKLLQNAGILIL